VPTLRIDKRRYPGFVKAYMHNGYFKDLKTVVHFYNTRDVLPRCQPNDREKLAGRCPNQWKI
jgi:cytochrome c peroxidase